MKETIFIIHPHSNLVFNVTLNYLIKCLIGDDFNLVIFTNCTQSKLHFKAHENVQVKTLPLFYPRPPRKPLLYLEKTFSPLMEAKSLWRKHKGAKIICIDPEGFHTAYNMFPSQVKNFNYISFEIFFMDELKEERNIKIQKKAIQLIKNGINSLIIPDHYRLKLFLNEYLGSKINQTFFIPVAPSQTYLPTADDLAKVKFKPELNEGEKAIIYSGSLYDWSGIKELIKAMADQWDKKFRLFIHSQSINSGVRTNLESFIAQHAPQLGIQILDIQLEYTDYLAFLMQFDIGLATYIPFTSDSPYDGKNFAEIGYSSSKFNTLMMLGMPTITTTNNSFNDIKKEYDFGYILKDFSEINTALAYIDENFEQNKSAALAAYQNILNPADKVKTFIKFMHAEYNSKIR